MITKQQFVENETTLRNAVGGRDHWLGRFRDREEADKAVQGQVAFRFPMTLKTPRYVDVGRHDIDWTGAHIKHQEWPAQLNRCFMVGALANAYRDTGNEDFAAAARNYIEDWITAHPSRQGWDKGERDSTLNMCIRLRLWGPALYEFRDSPHFDQAFFDRISASCACQIEYLCTHFSRGGNWRIANADGALMSALRWRQLPGAARWINAAVRVLNDAFHRQVLPDGVHIERTPGYHIWMTQVFDHLWRLAQVFPDLGLHVSADVVARMYDYAAAATKPNGHLNGVHDCPTAHTGQVDPPHVAKRQFFLERAGLESAMPSLSQAFPAAGQACWRTGWNNDAVYVAFDASSWGGNHCHLSRNAVQLHAYGRSLLVDPGTLNYEASDPIMAVGKGTRAHNTVNLNGWNQCEADPITRFSSIPGYDLATGDYAGGYWSHPYAWSFVGGHGAGAWGKHHRTVLWARDTAVIVIDRVRFDARRKPDEPTVESNWQFSGEPVRLDREARYAVTDHDDGNVLVLLPPASVPDELTLYKGHTDPLRAWVLDENGTPVGAPQVSRTCATERSVVDAVTVLVPFRGHEKPEVTAEVVYNHHGKLTLTWKNGFSDIFLWAYELGFPLDECDGMTTDASLVHVHRAPNGRVTRGMAADATFLEPHTGTARETPAMFSF